ncbi:MAG: S8 family serine peptidase [Verrucomicrobiales bacterium]
MSSTRFSLGFLFLTHGAEIPSPVSGAVSGLNQTIAVIDDGLELNHPDMRPATFAGDHFDLIDGDKDPTPFPFDAHGTAVAAIAGARGDNLNGMAGIAYRSNLAGIRFLENSSRERKSATRIESRAWRNPCARRILWFPRKI